MKTITHLLWSIVGLFLMAGCQDDDHSFQPDEAIIKAFNEKYPNATQVEWEAKHSYITAEFSENGQAHEAWFGANGQWQMTVTELRSKDELPGKVITALSNSEYKDWQIDDMDRLERVNSETVYVVEVKKGNAEYDLYYTEDGILIKSVADIDDDDEHYLPGQNDFPKIREFITKQYPNARIVEIEKESPYIEADIIHQNRKKEVTFDLEQEWLHTHYDVPQTEVEEVVLQTLQNSYKGYNIDDIEKYETPTVSYYLFELEKDNQEIEVKINQNGDKL